MTELAWWQDRRGDLTGPRAFLNMMRGKGQVEPDEDVLEDAIAFAGAAKLTARIKCALLSWMAFQDALVRAQEDSHA